MLAVALRVDGGVPQHGALEAVVDLASPERHPLARVGKDVGAAAVLIAALAAAAVGLLILLPPLASGWGFPAD